MDKAWRPKWERYLVAKQNAEDLMAELVEGVAQLDQVELALEARRQAERDFLDAYPIRRGGQ